MSERINLGEQAQVDSLTTIIIKDGAVTSQKIAAGAITGDNLDPSIAGEGLVYNPTTKALDVNVDLSELQITADTVQIKDGAVTTVKMNIDADLSFNNFQAKNFRVENVSSDPAAGNIGRLIYRTDTSLLKIDDGTSFNPISGTTVQDHGTTLPTRTLLDFEGSGVTVLDTGTKIQVTVPQGGHAIEDEGVPLPQRSILNFVGPGVTASDTGTETQVSISSVVNAYAKTLVTVFNPITDRIIHLVAQPVTNSEIVGLNGLILRPGLANDYTLSGGTITINAGVNLTVGDEMVVVYAY